MDRPRLVAVAALVVAACSGSDDGDGQLDTAAAAAAIGDAVEDSGGAALDECPGDVEESLDDIAAALGGELTGVVDDGEVYAAALSEGDDPPVVAIVCGASDGTSELWLVASPDPASAGEVLGGDDAEPAGSAHGGTLEVECGPTDGECSARWTDDELLLATGGSGDAWDGIDGDEVAAALVDAVPALADRLADAD